MQGDARAHRIRVGGTVEPGSIHRSQGRVDFLLDGEGKQLPVSYVGSDPLPDTFIDKSQALVEGSLERNGTFTAQQVKANCERKYEAAHTAQPPEEAGGSVGSASNAPPRSSM